ncbi:carboxyl-terminal-processing peptidase 1, chloroplastic [Dorcoceras hygrometricum]|uniref:Carboxyl-terminal-processing peptidase 1, chloroplastic n=1 Tax=Dorcoceras hygrometricum TaxID=472368 RepID=A0A2Z7AZI0_9LAMI|nr:carboxyl-terminal-processing peptidase 1, chloroplastic [Dorcoceras hygrometricum]
MVKRLATSPHDPLGIIDSACKNQLIMVSVQYGPFNTYIPIRSMTIGKSRVARDPITMHTSRRSNSDITCVTSIGYPRTKASGESSTTKHRLLHASGPHTIPPPDDPNRVGKRVKVRHLSFRVSMMFRVVRANMYNQDLRLIHSTNGKLLLHKLIKNSAIESRESSSLMTLSPLYVLTSSLLLPALVSAPAGSSSLSNNHICWSELASARLRTTDSTLDVSIANPAAV